MKTANDYSETAKAEFNDESERSLFQAGFAFASGIPEHNLEMLADGMGQDEAKDTAFDAWNEVQDNSRQFSPFEFTAKALNDMEDSEKAWELFEEGINAAFEHAWQTVVLRRFTFAE